MSYLEVPPMAAQLQHDAAVAIMLLLWAQAVWNWAVRL